MVNNLKHNDLNSIVEMISQAQNRAYLAFNTELVSLYWQVGQHVSNKVNQDEWGSTSRTYPQHNSIDERFYQRAYYCMKRLYETYHEIEKMSALLTQLSWTNHLNILSKCKSIDKQQNGSDS